MRSPFDPSGHALIVGEVKHVLATLAVDSLIRKRVRFWQDIGFVGMDDRLGAQLVKLPLKFAGE
jgi:hypothetical protein